MSDKKDYTVRELLEKSEPSNNEFIDFQGTYFEDGFAKTLKEEVENDDEDETDEENDDEDETDEEVENDNDEKEDETDEEDDLDETLDNLDKKLLKKHSSVIKERLDLIKQDYQKIVKEIEEEKIKDSKLFSHMIILRCKTLLESLSKILSLDDSLSEAKKEVEKAIKSL